MKEDKSTKTEEAKKQAKTELSDNELDDLQGGLAAVNIKGQKIRASCPAGKGMNMNISIG